MTRARAVLICPASEPLNRFGLARWMASFLDLAAIVEIHEPPSRLRKRVGNGCVTRTRHAAVIESSAFRLERGRYAIPTGDSGSSPRCEIATDELGALLSSIDLFELRP